MFGNAGSASVIRNLRLVNSYFENSKDSGDAYFGAVAGYMDGKMDTVYSDAIVVCKGNESGGLIGRLAGDGSSIVNCWFAGSITGGGKYCGGIVGRIANNATLKHCLNTGTVVSTYATDWAGAGGLCGAILNLGTPAPAGIKVEVEDCLNVGKVTVNQTEGVGSLMGRARNTTSFANCYTTEEIVHAKGEQIRTNYAIDGVGNATTYLNEVSGVPVIMSKADLTGADGYLNTYLDFDSWWIAMENGTPELASFAGTDRLDVSGLIKVDTSWYDEAKNEFTIATVEQLYGFMKLSGTTDFAGKTIKLGADITVNTGEAATWAATPPAYKWTSVGSAGMPFMGTFDGQGHTLSGIYISVSGQRNGLFGSAGSTSVIRNFRLVNSYFSNTRTSGDAYIGSIVGYMEGNLDTIYSEAIVECGGWESGGLVGRLAGDGSSISNCWFAGSITGGGKYCGGIVGRIANNAAMEHCLNTGTVTSTFADSWAGAGGLCGAVLNLGTAVPASIEVKVNDCLNAGKVTVSHTEGVGSFMGRSRNTISFANCYTTNDIVHAQGKTIATNYAIDGVGNATTNSNKVTGAPVIASEAALTGSNSQLNTTLDFDNWWSAMKDGTPELTSFAGPGRIDASEVIKADTSWYDAEKSEYTIDTVAQLYGFKQLSDTTDFAGKTVKLGADITVNTGEAGTWADTPPANAWVSIGTASLPFAGTFDGQGHTVSGLYMSASGQNVGFFGITTTACLIKDFRLLNSYFANSATGDVYMGSIVGQLKGKLCDVYSNAIVVSRGNETGGMVGRMRETGCAVNNCWFDGSVTSAGQYCGGIIGRLMGTAGIEHCLNSGSITSTRTAGWAGAGGICGAIYWGSGADGIQVVFNDCLNVGSVTVSHTEGVGSFLGRSRNTTTFTNCYTTNDIKHVQGSEINYTYTVPGVGNATTYQNKITGAPEVVDREAIVGNAAFTNLGGLDFENYWSAVEESTPELTRFRKGKLIPMAK